MQLIIDGTDVSDLIAYNGFKWQRQDVDGPSAGRNIRGDMIRDRVGTKIRLDIKCKPLETAQLRMLLNLILPVYVTVTYDDPMYGRTTKTMYSNNNPAEFLLKRNNGRDLWSGVTFPLVER